MSQAIARVPSVEKESMTMISSATGLTEEMHRPTFFSSLKVIRTTDRPAISKSALRYYCCIFPFPDLLSPHRIVQPFFLQQAAMTAHFHHLSFLQHIDPVGMHDGG